MGDYSRLEVWRRAHALMCELYEVTRTFPTEERYVLTSQLRRASLSTASNIVEGYARRSDPALRHFLRIAIGSATEVDYLLLAASDTGSLSREKATVLRAKARHVIALLGSFLRSLGVRWTKIS
jgi:four helix bundle protein